MFARARPVVSMIRHSLPLQAVVSRSAVLAKLGFGVDIVALKTVSVRCYPSSNLPTDTATGDSLDKSKPGNYVTAGTQIG
jgi:hypothetical protein